MTSPLLRKPRITPHAPKGPIRIWASLALLFAAGVSSAQVSQSAPTARPASQTTPPVRMVHPQPAPVQPIQPVYYQPNKEAEAQTAPFLQLESPGLGRLSRLDSDERLQRRIEQLDPTAVHVFPESPILSRDRYAGRGQLWQRRQITVEPNYVNFGKLQPFFEDKNAERYGWDLGPLSIPVALTKFASDVVLFPAKALSDPCRLHDSSAGHCLPGDPVPYMIYPPEIATITGTAAELAVIGALIVVFP